MPILFNNTEITLARKWVTGRRGTKIHPSATSIQNPKPSTTVFLLPRFREHSLHFHNWSLPLHRSPSSNSRAGGMLFLSPNVWRKSLSLLITYVEIDGGTVFQPMNYLSENGDKFWKKKKGIPFALEFSSAHNLLISNDLTFCSTHKSEIMTMRTCGQKLHYFYHISAHINIVKSKK